MLIIFGWTWRATFPFKNNVSICYVPINDWFGLLHAITCNTTIIHTWTRHLPIKMGSIWLWRRRVARQCFKELWLGLSIFLQCFIFVCSINDHIYRHCDNHCAKINILTEWITREQWRSCSPTWLWAIFRHTNLRRISMKEQYLGTR